MGSNQWYNNGYYGTSSPQDQVSSPSEHFHDYYQSHPLARDGSSGGSSQASSIPESPSHNSYYALHDSSPVQYSTYQQQYLADETRTDGSSVPRSEAYVLISFIC